MFDIPSTEWGVVFAIVIIEALMSVDNALVNASIAAHLPKRQRGQAIAFGIGAGAILRIMVLFAAGFVAQNPWVKLAGAGYLIYLCVKHFFFDKKEEGVTHARGKSLERQFWGSIGAIALADLAFSIDNVVAAVGMSDYIMVVIVGVLAGIITMIFATQLVVLLLSRYPRLEHTAFLLVGFVGAVIVVEEAHTFLVGVPAIHVPALVKFGVTLGAVLLTFAWEEGERYGERRKARELARASDS